VSDEHHRIGEVAERVRLSLRTIRYYEEIGLVEPSGRTDGGFRLYTESDIERLHLVKALKPVGMSLETMGELLRCADALNGTEIDEPGEVEHRFQEVLELAHSRCDELEERLAAARSALAGLERYPAAGR
jgi:DNA-binding transcriptional MerR regulator